MHLTVFQNDIVVVPCGLAWEEYVHVTQAGVIDLFQGSVTLLDHLLCRPALRLLLLFHHLVVKLIICRCHFKLLLVLLLIHLHGLLLIQGRVSMVFLLLSI